jgi:hypothetical protein
LISLFGVFGDLFKVIRQLEIIASVCSARMPENIVLTAIPVHELKKLALVTSIHVLPPRQKLGALSV